LFIIVKVVTLSGLTGSTYISMDGPLIFP
jgi:hypothetical protein